MPNLTAAYAVLITAAMLLFPNHTEAVALSRNLQIGDQGNDVLELQKFLNTFAESKISVSGPGSPGNETGYFGQLTKLAVIRYQEKFFNEILLPHGLVKGTGFVGESTRKQMLAKHQEPKKNLASNTPPQAPLTSSTSPSSGAITTTYLIEPSQYSATAGSKINISGFNLSEKNNTLIFKNGDREERISPISSPSRNSLSVTVPSLPVGKYDIWLENEFGKSEHPTFLVIKNPDAQNPIIESVTPSSGGYGSTITITGKNFSTKNNELRTNYRIIPGISSSDGITLQVPLALFPDIPQLQTGIAPKQNISLPVFFIVVNENGVSDRNKPGQFKLEL